MPSPPAAAAAEEDQVRPSPPMKLKLVFPYTVPRGFGRCACGMAMLGTGFFMCVVKILSFTTDAEEARFWIPIILAALYLCVAAIVLMACVDIGNYLAGVCAVKFDPPPQLQQQQQPAAAALQLPPPPPEMDMC